MEPRYMHFDKDGVILSQYDPARSVLPISMFPTGQGRPSRAEMMAMGLNQVSVPAFFNPNDNIGWRNMTFEAWKAYFDANYNAVIEPYIGFLFHHVLDDLFRSPAQQEFLANCPWAYDALTYAVDCWPPGAIMLDTMDEIGFDPTIPIFNAAFDEGINRGYKLSADTWDKVQACLLCNVSWPSYARSPYAKAWDTKSDYLDIYTASQQTTLAGRIADIRASQSARIDPSKPWVCPSDVCSEDPANPVSYTGRMALGEMLHHVLIMGAAGLRLYAYSPAHPSWPEVKAAATVGCKWLQAHVKDVLQPILSNDSPDPRWAYSRRAGTETYINLTETSRILNTDSFGKRYVITPEGVSVATGHGDHDSLTVPPNAAVVYIRS